MNGPALYIDGQWITLLKRPLLTSLNPAGSRIVWSIVTPQQTRRST